MAKQFDVGYEKWQSEQAVGTLDLAVEQEALKLKSRLKQGLTNKTFVLDDEEDFAVAAPKTSGNSQHSQHTKSFSDAENASGNKTEHSSEHNCPVSQNSGQISHVTSSSSSINEVFTEVHDSTPQSGANLTPVDASSFKIAPPLPARPNRDTRHRIMS
ncbi:uncharacterized protein LOC142356771, partial [Convolutriloba macropyga]|uniref:uncharacterized protein LOC142356771 n=1 Tax=Convolutriloba macropyga TaxID=536237 RepID=UPI003F527F61